MPADNFRRHDFANSTECTGDVIFDDVVLPTTARLGEAGTAWKHVLATLAVFRVSVAGAAVGLMEGALEEAVRHTREREQFGKPLSRQGPVAAMLADSWADLESAHLLTRQAAAMAAALKTLGSPVTYSELPGTNHNSWDAAYASPALTDWLFAQRRG